MALGETATAGVGWTCRGCGYRNETRQVCDRCGVSRRWSIDPPLDAPPAPRHFERPADWWALLHASLALFGVVLLMRPETAPLLALAPVVQAGQVALSLAAAWASANHAAMERLFWRTELEVPSRVAAGDEIAAHVRLVPYGGVERVGVRVALLENTYERSRRGRSHGVRTRSTALARYALLEHGSLPGRRANEFEARFTAPFPTGAHRDVHAELQASLMGALAWIVPGLGGAARNLREHGGVWVRLTLRCGPWRRRIEARVLVYQLSPDGFHVA